MIVQLNQVNAFSLGCQPDAGSYFSGEGRSHSLPRVPQPDLRPLQWPDVNTIPMGPALANKATLLQAADDPVSRCGFDPRSEYHIPQAQFFPLELKRA